MGLLDKVSLLLTPNAVKESKLYSIIPSNGTGDLTATRNTTATRVNSLALIESVAANVPRLNYDSVGAPPVILFENQRTNLLLNSASLSTQSITTTASLHTLSFRGTGTVTLSGSFTGSLAGTGANNRVTLTFTPTSATLTVTISGTCNNGQIELGGFATSNIPTLGSAVTRNQDLFSKTGITDLIGQNEGVFFLEMKALFNDSTNRQISISDGTSNNTIIIGYGASANQLSLVLRQNSSTIFQSFPSITNALVINKIALSYKSGNIGVFVNGVKIISNTSTFTYPSNTFNTLSSDFGNGANRYFGSIKGLQLYKTQLTDAECVSLTTL
tara:strand:+ start:702 stop:1688 length:987 start_codon:yes stop_codon:yes gene_type:complete